MLASVVRDHVVLQEDPSLRCVLAASHYLAPSGPAALGVVIEDPFRSDLLQQEITAQRLPVMLARREAGIPPEVPYTYAPGTEAAAALRVQDLRAILLSIAAEAPDTLLLDRSVGHGGVAEAGLADGLVLRRGAAGRWRRGARTARLYPATLPAISGAPVSMQPPGQAGKAQCVAMPAPVLDRDPRPVVFVLPAFLALGGVERFTVETMRHLAPHWRFVVVTIEALRAGQGSMHEDAAEVATVYDLSELTGTPHRLRTLELLLDWHGPALVWIMNGAPWQVNQAAAIRAMFHDIPFIDQQVYDHKAGWINRYGDAGLRAADRLIAINKKIQRVTEGTYRIPSQQIDLVYRGADTSCARRRDIDPEIVAAHRIRFGLDPARPLFGVVGRLNAQKRPLDLVALAKKHPSVQFTWTGPGEMAGEVQKALARVPNMRLIPSKTDLRPIYEMIDGLIVTSEFEGLPLVVLEALSMGLPMMSSDVGAIKEVLDRYGSGIVYAPPGDLAALNTTSKAFRRALPEYRAAAQREAAQVAEDFSSGQMAREYDASFRAALAGFQPV